jgi:RimJ/RimL family protein N-acetyltransferase
MYRFCKQTPRLTLREMRPEDAPALALLNADPEVVRYTGDVPFASVEQAREFLENYPSISYLRDGYGRWLVLERDSDEVLGWCGLRMQDCGEVDLGYRLVKRCWGLGYATEAAAACLDAGFGELGLAVIVARAANANVASLRVLEKLGMRVRGPVQCHGMDSTQYALTREAWSQHPLAFARS